MRLDKYLIEANIFTSRTSAKQAIEEGKIKVDGKLVTRPSFDADGQNFIEFSGEKQKFVSRGGIKLEAIIKACNIDLNNKIIIDLGASTGGFTDVCLQSGAKKVFAVDVGTNQLINTLKKDKRVVSLEKTDARSLGKDIFEVSQMIVSDISFISIAKVYRVIFDKINKGTEVITLIKPQFECGKELAKKFHGVIKDTYLAQKICKQVIDELTSIGFTVLFTMTSPIEGGDGNTEFLTYLKKD